MTLELIITTLCAAISTIVAGWALLARFSHRKEDMKTAALDHSIYDIKEELRVVRIQVDTIKTLVAVHSEKFEAIEKSYDSIDNKLDKILAR